MKALLVTALLALAFTTGFTCSKNAPEAAAPTETAPTDATATAPTEAAPAEATGTAEAAVAPATTEAAPATETK